MASDSLGSEFLCLCEEPRYCSRTLVVRAHEPRDVQTRFPRATVVQVESQTLRSPAVIERMRYAVGPFQDPGAPARARTAGERAVFEQERQAHVEALRTLRLAAGDSPDFIEQVLRRPLWVDLGDERSIQLAVRDWPEV